MFVNMPLYSRDGMPCSLFGVLADVESGRAFGDGVAATPTAKTPGAVF